MRAFHGNVETKQALLMALKAEAEAAMPALPLLRAMPDPDTDLADFIEAFALHAALIALIKMLVSQDRSFAAKLVEVLEPSVDTLALVHQWVLCVFTAPPEALIDRLDSADAKRSALAILDLHTAALEGRPVSPSDWRAVRNAAGSLEPTTDAEKFVLRAVAATAWDLERTPGAAADLLYDWWWLEMSDVDKALQWDPEKEAASQERFEQMMAAARANAGEPPRPMSADEQKVWVMETDEGRAWYKGWLKRFNEGRQAFWDQNPSPLDERPAAQTRAVERVSRTAASGLLILATSAAVQAA